MKVYIIRHPETIANVEGRVAGTYDTPWTKKGEAQALSLVVWAKTKVCQKIITSPHMRAKGLAQRLVSIAGQDLFVEEAFQELKQGILEGLTYQEIEATNKDLYMSLMAGEERISIPGGEDLDSFKNRVMHAFFEWVAQGEDFLMVTHGAVIRTILLELDLVSKAEIFKINLSPGVCLTIDVTHKGCQLTELIHTYKGDNDEND